MPNTLSTLYSTHEAPCASWPEALMVSDLDFSLKEMELRRRRRHTFVITLSGIHHDRHA